MSNGILASQLAKQVKGKLYGEDKLLTGQFTFLNKANNDDIVIRHWINAKGIEIAEDKGVACVITQNPQDNAIQTVEDGSIALIVTDHIEYATAFAIRKTVTECAGNAFKVAVTGTNGKSTTTHILYTIFSDLDYNTYTNTDAESEGNTLIDPRVSTEIYDYYQKMGLIDVIALEVSEVQGWDDRIMEDHSYQMISALDADVSIITNASKDHMNLVESFDELLYEISGAARSLLNNDRESLLVLNYDDYNIRQMAELVQDKSNIRVMFFGLYDSNNPLDVYYKDNVGIYAGDELYIEYDNLPFTSVHFIQDIMATIAVCVYKGLDNQDVVNSLKNYKPLARRFIRLKSNPVIIDDFAHNPSGIKLTIENGSKLGENLYVIDAIRGSRGEDINSEIAQALSDTLRDLDNYVLVLTKSCDVVNNLNTVTEGELKVFTSVLDDNNIQYTVYDDLEQSLVDTIKKAGDDDVVLLLGAQGMDPASGLLKKNNIIR